MNPIRDAREILVFRALMLGDWLCATPALRALRALAPQARIVLCGLPWTAELAARLSSVDEFLEFPGHPALPERPVSPAVLARFVDQVRQRRFDVVVQMHGSGSVVNPLIASFDAGWTAGFALPQTAGLLDLPVRWPDRGTEIERCLALTDALGAPPLAMQLDFPLSDTDRQRASRLLDEAGVRGPFAIVHPGSQLPSRRWLPERFALVAEEVARRGLAVVLTGSSGEASIASAVRSACRSPVHELTGRTTLGDLAALVEAATLVVANDTGISHVAAAVRTPSVIVACGSDVKRWAPLDWRLHRVHWAPSPCRPCSHASCPTAHECATGVPAYEVVRSSLELLRSHR
ncbi:MAG TPA: glycosyltransferase family 9 protein [Burkholderiaceae bacterium]|nr:glycosyltransferase family 9 protein [Burkholderiaceae bacterium]